MFQWMVAAEVCDDEISAVTLVSDMHCVGMQCCVERSHFMTDHSLGC
jgi:hypothetical protein